MRTIAVSYFYAGLLTAQFMFPELPHDIELGMLRFHCGCGNGVRYLDHSMGDLE